MRSQAEDAWQQPRSHAAAGSARGAAPPHTRFQLGPRTAIACAEARAHPEALVLHRGAPAAAGPRHAEQLVHLVWCGVYRWVVRMGGWSWWGGCKVCEDVSEGMEAAALATTDRGQGGGRGRGEGGGDEGEGEGGDGGGGGEGEGEGLEKLDTAGAAAAGARTRLRA